MRPVFARSRRKFWCDSTTWYRIPALAAVGDGRAMFAFSLTHSRFVPVSDIGDGSLRLRRTHRRRRSFGCVSGRRQAANPLNRLAVDGKPVAIDPVAAAAMKDRTISRRSLPRAAGRRLLLRVQKRIVDRQPVAPQGHRNAGYSPAAAGRPRPCPAARRPRLQKRRDRREGSFWQAHRQPLVGGRSKLDVGIPL
jgi:hypothetical protein